MKCIIVTEDFLMKRNIEKLMISNNLNLLSTFNSTSEAAIFITNNCVDVLFFDIQMCDFDNIEFIHNIPEKTFVIYVSEFQVPDKELFADSVISKRFRKSVDEAQVFQEMILRESIDIKENYFVI